jgi:hypothetical protein
MTLRERFDDDMTTCPTTPMAFDDTPVADTDLAALPDSARRYLRYMGVVGRPADHGFRAHLFGRFRRRPAQRWTRCEAWQHNSVAPVSRIFHLRLDFARVLPMYGRDTYLDGRGRMRVKVLGLTVADQHGPELDLGELVTFLDDAVVFAPSMLLRLPVTWTAVDDDSFDLSLTDHGTTVRARVSLTAEGAPCDFSTEDRYADLPGGLVRARWSTPLHGWTAGARPYPARGSAIWHLPSGPFTYAEFEFSPTSVEHGPSAAD